MNWRLSRSPAPRWTISQVKLPSPPSSDDREDVRRSLGALHALRIPGTSLTQSLKMQADVETAVKAFPEVDKVFAKLGTAEVATDTAPTSEAAFSNCNWLMDVAWRAASLQCWTNTGPWWASYRAVLKCSDGSVHRGPWRNNGSWSRTGTVCPWTGSGVAKWMETTG